MVWPIPTRLNFPAQGWELRSKAFHEPSPHPDPLPSHRMGAEREQRMDTICSTAVWRAAAGSWSVRSSFWNRRLSMNPHLTLTLSLPIGWERRGNSRRTRFVPPRSVEQRQVHGPNAGQNLGVEANLNLLRSGFSLYSLLTLFLHNRLPHTGLLSLFDRRALRGPRRSFHTDVLEIDLRMQLT